MNTPASMLKVAPTSALVLYYAKTLYTDPLSCKYLQYINLSDVQPLIAALSQLNALAEKHLGISFYCYSRKKILNILELLHAEVHDVYEMQAEGWLEMVAFHL